jgi:hypothetical protein
VYLPDYLAAREALAALVVGHQAQHRCTDGIYYSTPQSGNCPTRQHAATILETLLTAQTVAHTAVHDTEHVDLVLLGMTGLVAADLTAEDRDAWRLTTRNALEAHVALLDPTVTA